ncbi:RNA-binding protein MEX3B-like [Saccoglossus kowalevskii]|uniref:RNA-binding protein MEX3B-like n=1 Tax=Saccoglossus kowalevskii TaxID=10224 RepID=A0ABM0GIR6_SACKO|nr:PREDICTED: RNA-binding protein MEX3B-like [Saccoglossus kowalevskii]
METIPMQTHDMSALFSFFPQFTSSLFPDMERPGLEEQQLQLAIDLNSVLGLNGSNGEDERTSFSDAEKAKKSVNMTECVPVPSSEHVAEIVGRQGCKIKALRAKTNTYIKTPVRGEEPVFVVTGRKEDVAMARREILSAAEHFSQIRASRKNNAAAAASLAPGPPGPNTPGMTTIQVRVPYRVVGLVVGPKGATIKRIQQTTHTYIVTPSREKEPVFEVTGLPENVERAREEIESHIAMRTGGLIDSTADENDFAINGTDSGINAADDLGPLYGNKPGNSAFTSFRNSNNFLPGNTTKASAGDMVFSFVNTNGTTKISDFNPNVTPFSTASSTSTTFTNNLNGYSLFNSPQVSPDLGIDVTSYDPSAKMWTDLSHNAMFNPTTTAASSIPRRSSSISSASPQEGPTVGNSGDHPPARRIHSDPLSGGITTITSSYSPIINSFPSSTTSSTGSGSTSASTSPTNSIGSMQHPKKGKECMMCFESEVVAALVPCGHNLFCMECANRLMEKSDPECPVCHQTITQAIRIFS